MARHNYRPEHTVCSLLYRLSMVLLVFWMPSWLGWAVRIGPKKKNEPKKPPTIFECIGIVSESIRRCCLSFGELMITFVAGSAAWSSNPLMQTQAKFSVPVPVPVASPPFPIPHPGNWNSLGSSFTRLDSTGLDWTGRGSVPGPGLMKGNCNDRNQNVFVTLAPNEAWIVRMTLHSWLWLFPVHCSLFTVAVGPLGAPRAF